MYIFELLANAFKSKKYRRFEYADEQNEARYLAEETENCEHEILRFNGVKRQTKRQKHFQKLTSISTFGGLFCF